MTVKELKEALNHFEDDATIFIVSNKRLDSYISVLGTQEQTYDEELFYSTDFKSHFEFSENNKATYCVIF